MTALNKLLENSKDFYYIEYEGSEMLIRPYGYFYCAGGSVTDDPEQIYRFEEYDRLVFTHKEFWECNYRLDEDNDKYMCRRGDLMYDLSGTEAKAMLLDLMDEMGSARRCVPYDCIEEGMEPGLYYDGPSLLWEE